MRDSMQKKNLSVLNRTTFFPHLKEKGKQMKEPYACDFIDLDHFKRVGWWQLFRRNFDQYPCKRVRLSRCLLWGYKLQPNLSLSCHRRPPQHTVIHRVSRHLFKDKRETKPLVEMTAMRINEMKLCNSWLKVSLPAFRRQRDISAAQVQVLVAGSNLSTDRRTIGPSCPPIA